MDPARLAPPAPSAELDALARLIVDSHLRVVGRPLLDEEPKDVAGLRQALWTAPRAVVAHDTQADPVFSYGNRLALELFELDFAAFTALPSRYSAEPVAREERAALLDRVTRHGFIDDYAGIRISSSGRRFMIRRATVWNLIDVDGVYRGQAATFSEWETIGGPRRSG